MSIARLLASSAVVLALALGSTADAHASGRQGATPAVGKPRARRTTGAAAAQPTRPQRRTAAEGDASLATSRSRTTRAAAATGATDATGAAGTRRTSTAGKPARLTRDQRHDAAVRGVQKELRNWVRGGVGVEVRTTLQQIQISPNNRILGRGPVDIVVSPKLPAKATRLQRWTAAFRPGLNRRMMVSVNEYGNATILDIESNTIQAQVGRAISKRVPIVEIVTDIFTSKQAQGGLVAAVASIPAFFANPAAGGVIATTAAGLLLAGRKERSANRDGAFRRTMTWARAREKAGNRPALTEMHNYYNLQLKNTSTRGIGFRKFVERIALEDFDGQGDTVETEDPPPAP
jgi:hypothetical protein